MEEWKGKYLPAIAMVSWQCIYAIMALLNRAALLKGMSPRVFIFYRQVIATLVLSPFALFRRGESAASCKGVKSFLLIFVSACLVWINQASYFEGLYLASSSIASAMSNIIPALTFLTAAIMGLEQVNLMRLSSAAKILGTALCVGGAVSMALLKGPELLKAQILPQFNSLVFQSLGGDSWLLGCLYLFASSCSWSFWLILQVPTTACYPDHISLSAWMCFLAMLQAGAIALFYERDLKAWDLSSKLELTCCFFSGIFGSGFQYFVQSWCVSQRGPVFTSMFSPLCTVIATALACIFLHEQIYLGSLLGAIAVIIGLYVVLWGKSEELKEKVLKAESETITASRTAQDQTSCEVDLEQPLLMDHSTN